MDKLIVYGDSYVHHAVAIDHFLDAVREKQMLWSSDDLYVYGLDEIGLQLAIKRAMNACLALDMSIKKHFKPVYLCNKDSISPSWKLTETAFKLVFINADTINANVARYQIKLIS